MERVTQGQFASPVALGFPDHRRIFFMSLPVLQQGNGHARMRSATSLQASSSAARPPAASSTASKPSGLIQELIRLDGVLSNLRVPVDKLPKDAKSGGDLSELGGWQPMARSSSSSSPSPSPSPSVSSPPSPPRETTALRLNLGAVLSCVDPSDAPAKDGKSAASASEPASAPDSDKWTRLCRAIDGLGPAPADPGAEAPTQLQELKGALHAFRAKVAETMEKAKGGDPDAISVVVVLANSPKTLGPFAAEAKALVFHLYRTGDVAVRSALRDFAEENLFVRSESAGVEGPQGPSGSSLQMKEGLLQEADMAYLAGVSAGELRGAAGAGANQSLSPLEIRLAQWLDGIPSIGLTSSERRGGEQGGEWQARRLSTILAKDRFVGSEELQATLKPLGDRGGFTFLSPTNAQVPVDGSKAPDDLDLNRLQNVPDSKEKAQELLAQMAAACRAHQGRPAVVALEKQSHWILLVAAPKGGAAAAAAGAAVSATGLDLEYLVFDSNAVGDGADSVGGRLQALLTSSGVSCNGVLADLQREKAPHGCGPLCLLALEEVFLAKRSGDEPMTQAAIARRMGDFATHFSDDRVTSQVVRDRKISIARARLMQGLGHLRKPLPEASHKVESSRQAPQPASAAAVARGRTPAAAAPQASSGGAAVTPSKVTTRRAVVPRPAAVAPAALASARRAAGPETATQFVERTKGDMRVVRRALAQSKARLGQYQGLFAQQRRAFASRFWFEIYSSPEKAEQGRVAKVQMKAEIERLEGAVRDEQQRLSSLESLVGLAANRVKLAEERNKLRVRLGLARRVGDASGAPQPLAEELTAWEARWAEADGQFLPRWQKLQRTAVSVPNDRLAGRAKVATGATARVPASTGLRAAQAVDTSANLATASSRSSSGVNPAEDSGEGIGSD